MTFHGVLRGMVLGALLGGSMTAFGAPPTSHPATTAGTARAQLKDVDAKIAAARTHQDTLRAHLAKLEQENATQHKQLQQRDAEIAALQRKLAAAGAPTSSTSAGH